MKRNEMVGWFSLGLNSSGPEEAQHFNDMRDAANINGQVGKCDLIARWHVLMVRIKLGRIDWIRLGKGFGVVCKALTMKQHALMKQLGWLQP
jgi:hypothetical protein